MLAYVARRLVYSAVVLLVASFVVFVGVRVTKDPTARLAQVRDPRTRLAERERLHLDDNIVVQYGRWLGDFTRGDWGLTYPDREPVSKALGRAMPYTLELLLWGSAVSMLLAISIGIYSAVRQYSVGDYVFTGIAYVGIAMPTFWFGLMAIVYLSVKPKEWFGLDSVPFPFIGLPSPSLSWAYFGALALPVLTLCVQIVASWSRFTRASMLDTLSSDYIRTARAKGVPRRRVVIHHAFRNALIPVVTVIALDMALLFGGLVITETIFSIPGMGRLFVKAFSAGDAELVTAYVIVTAAFVVAGNLIADVLYGWLDPRVRVT